MRPLEKKRPLHTRRLILPAVVVCFAFAVNVAVASYQRRFPRSETLTPIPTPIGISGRKLFRLRHGDCIVLRPPIDLASDAEQQRYCGTDEETELVRHVPAPDSRWRIDPNRLEEESTFNCATFALGDVIGLTRADFLDPRAVSATNWKNPAHVLLQEFFDRRAVYSLAGIKWSELDQLESLREDDVVVFATHGSDDEYVHLGRIAKSRGRNRMLSKMGRGPIVIGTLQTTARAYEGRFDEIQIYRRR